MKKKTKNKRIPALPDGEFVHPYRIFQGAHCICRAKEIQNVSKNIFSQNVSTLKHSKAPLYPHFINNINRGLENPEIYPPKLNPGLVVTQIVINLIWAVPQKY